MVFYLYWGVYSGLQLCLVTYNQLVSNDNDPVKARNFMMGMGLQASALANIRVRLS